MDNLKTAQPRKHQEWAFQVSNQRAMFPPSLCGENFRQYGSIWRGLPGVTEVRPPPIHPPNPPSIHFHVVEEDPGVWSGHHHPRMGREAEQSLSSFLCVSFSIQLMGEAKIKIFLRKQQEQFFLRKELDKTNK